MAKDDGSIVIGVNLSVAQAERNLAKLKEKIQKTEQDITRMQSERGAAREKSSILGAEIEAEQRKLAELKQQLLEVKAIAQDKSLSESTREEAKLNIPSIKQEVDDQATRVRLLEAEYRKTENAVDRYDQKLKDANEQLKDMAEKAGQTQKQLAKIPPQMEKAHKHTSKFASRIREVVRSALIFTVISQTLAKFREWMGKVIQTNDEATAAMARLKGALLTLAQPIVEVVIPAFIKLVDWLSRVVGTIAGFVSALFGKTVEESANAAEQMNNEANAIEGVGAAAKKASKQLAAFDEINKLSFNGGGGGGGSSAGVIKPDFNFEKLDLPKWMDDLLAKLKLNIEDVFFNGDDLTGEQIAQNAIDAVAGLCGATVGFMLGGIPGAITGTLLGVLLGALINSLIFDNDGKMDKEELLSSLAVALGGLVGTVIGFKVGGIKGAALGAMVGMAVTGLLSSLFFNHDGKVDKEELLSLLIDALGGLVGGVIGFNIGGIKGAAIGATVGMAVTGLLTGLLFDNDGRVTANEVVDALQAVLPSIATVLGWTIGGIPGALLGLSIGIALTFLLEGIRDILNDGVTPENIAKLLVDMLPATGAIIGWFLGGPAGALIGLTLGVALTFVAKSAEWQSDIETEKILEGTSQYTKYYQAGMGDFSGLQNPEIKDPYQKYYEIGMNAAKGYQTGVEDGSKNVDTAVDNSLGNGMVGRLRGILEIHSPSKVFEEIARMCVAGFQNGFTLVAEMVPKVQSTLDAIYVIAVTFSQKVMDRVAQIKDGWSEAMGASQRTAMNATNGIANSYANMATRVTNSINQIIDRLNAIPKSISTTISISTSGSSLPPIGGVPVPHLAQGAVIPPNREFLAVLGDQRSGNNIEAPASLIKQMVREALRESGGTGGGRDITVILQMDKREFARTVYRANNDETQRVGVRLAGANA